jgi:hypothetical protein
MNDCVIDTYQPQTGRRIREDCSIINVADLYSRNDQGIYVRNADSPSSDAFGRTRVSDPNTLSDSQQEYGCDTRIIFDMAANGIYSLFDADGSVLDAVSGSLVGPTNKVTKLTPIQPGIDDGDYAILQTRQYHRYIPGKSHFIAITGVFASSADDTAELCIRSSTSGSPVENTKAQAEWNIDTFDGSGNENNPSGIKIDFTKEQILVFDAQWLGAGRVRCYFDLGGILYPAHFFNAANILTVPYTQTFNLPIRHEARTVNGGTDISVGYFDTKNGILLKLRSETPGALTNFQCYSVQSEGGFEARGFPRSASNKTVLRNITARTPVLSIRPKAQYKGIDNRAHTELVAWSVLVTGSVPCYIEIVAGYQNINATNWISVSDNSILEYNVDATTENGTGGTYREDYAPAAGTNKGSIGSDGTVGIRTPFTLSKIDELLARQFNLSIVATPLGADATIGGVFNWNEQTV